MKRFGRVLSTVLELTPVLFGLLLLLGKLQPIEGRIGHDFYHALPRLYLGALHFWRYGFAVPHYTPYLLGGIPFFADPQSYYYSLPQWLTFFVPPWEATEITVALFALAGYLGCRRLMEEDFGTSRRIARLVGLAFLTNGFVFAHLFVGHLTHHPFWLFPWIVHWAIEPVATTRWGRFRAASGIALCLAYFVFSGAFHMLVVLAAMGLVLLPFLVERHRRRGELRRWLEGIGVAGALALCACAGKIAAAVCYAANFVPASIDSVPRGPLSLFFLYFWLKKTTPLMLMFTSRNGARWAFGAWEYVGFLSKAVLPLAAAGGAALVFGAGERQRRVAGLMLGLGFFIVLVACGGPLNDHLPFFHRYHNPIKIMAALILPLLILAGIALERVRRLPLFRGVSPACALLVYLLATITLGFEFSSQADFFVGPRLGLTYPYRSEIWFALRAGRAKPVTRLVHSPGADDISPLVGVSSLDAYEPLFGYKLEAFHARVRPGRPEEEKDGYFNFTHPGCFLYPSYFRCRPWDRVRVRDREELTRFLAGQPAWGVPLWQSGLLRLGWLTLLMLAVACVLPIEGLVSLMGWKLREEKA